IATAGVANSLAQTVLKLTTPGVPDIYQGTEWWDFSLVDPDNRRPVDFVARQQAMGGNASIAELLGHWRDGRLKQQIIRRLLDLRTRRASLFAHGDYQPLLTGSASHGGAPTPVLAFQRSAGSARIIVLVLRHPGAALLDAAEPRVNPQWLGRLGGGFDPIAGATAGHYRDVLGGTQARVDSIVPAQWLRELPVAVLESVDQGRARTAGVARNAGQSR
ncbi:MAG: hypothetical protein ABI300_03615, partial [Rhodanobacter sp.]